MDLAIRGAIVISDGAYARDILIRDGRIAALVEPGASSADEEIDARGLFAMPGVVLHPTRRTVQAVGFLKDKLVWKAQDKEMERAFAELAKLRPGQFSIASRDHADSA